MVHLRLHQSFHARLTVLALFFLVVLAAILGRVFSLAIVEHRTFVLAAERQHQFSEILPSRRGMIYGADRSGALVPLALQKSFFTLVAVPKDVADPGGAARALAGLAAVPEAELLAKLSKGDDPYEILARKLDDATTEKIRALGLEGITLGEETRRVYPQGTLASSLLGFVSYASGEERGEYGIEKQYEAHLKGERGFFSGERDAAGFWVAIGKRILDPPENGDSVVLTIDPNIQFRAEDVLERLMERWGAESGSALVVEPATGRIRAFASRPTFDPNEYSKVEDYSRFRAPLVDAQFELGSAFKPITMAGGLNEGVVTASTTYQDPGTIAFRGFTISNFDGRSHGVQTMTQVLEKSLNTGVVFVAQRLGQERFLEYLTRFGFGAPTGVDFPGEVSGDISNLASGRDIDYATASFGQGIAVTPLQLAAAIGAVANQGTLMRPYVVEKIVDDAGNEEIRKPQAAGEVIRPETAETLTRMLVSVVRNGFDRGGVKGYFVAGKTGTAQIPLSNGRGYSDEFIHTIVGYAPAFDPKFLILLQLNKPTGNRFAANTLSPAFRELAEFMLNYYEIPPDEK